MAKSNNRNIIILVSVSVIAVIIIGGLTGIIPLDISFNDFRNTTKLSISDAVPIDCDVRNILELEFTDGTLKIAYAGTDGFIPDTQSLILVDLASGKEIKEVHIQLTLQCAGSLIRSGGATISGTNNHSVCTYISDSIKECLSISGTQFTGILPLINKPFSHQDGLQQSPIQSQQITDRVEKVIYQAILTTDDIIRLFGDPPRQTSVHSTMFPRIIFNVGGQTLAYDGLKENDRTTTSWSGWTNVQPPVDTDGDGFDDLNDQCPVLPEDFNGFEDDDGCPDTVPIPDTDGDGILDNVDVCPIIIGTAPNGCPDSFLDLDFGNDSDGDGVLDQNDQCPTIAGLAGSFNGCLVVFGDTPADGDGDGVVEEFDKCRDTPINTSVDFDGCPDGVSAPTQEIISEPVEEEPCPDPSLLLSFFQTLELVEPCPVEVEVTQEVIMEEVEEVIMEEVEEVIIEEVVSVPTVLPPPLFEPLPPPIQTPDIPITTTAPLPVTTEDEQRQFVILILLGIGVLGIIIAGLVTRARRR